MDPEIQHKIDEYIKMAKSHKGYVTSSRPTFNRNDSLAAVIRTKKDAEDFMADLESAFTRARNSSK
jgi:hypothetical protein